jgi:hypothetical protein
MADSSHEFFFYHVINTLSNESDDDNEIMLSIWLFSDVVRDYNDYFWLKKNSTCKLGFTSYRKCTPAMRMLAHGVASDLVDEYMCMTESTFLESMHMFCKAVIQVFAGEYLREPRCRYFLVVVNESREISGMLGSIACTGSGMTIHLLRNGNTKVMWKGEQSYLRRLHHTTYGFATLSSAWQASTMTATCFNALWCSLHLRKAMLQWSHMRSMVTIMTQSTISPMVSILPGPHL